MSRCRSALWVAAQCALLSLAAGCSPFVAASATERMILGVQTHFAYDRTMDGARVIEWVKSARVDSTRDEMFWADVEDANGSFALRNSAQSTRELWWNQLPATAPLLILGYGNPRYDAGGQPRSAEAIKAYADHARWLVGETRSRVRMVEMWNEWNLKAGANPKGGAQGGAEDYVRMATAAGRAVKAVDPGVLVLVGGVGEDHPDWRWTREALAAGLLDAADGVSVHLYNHCDRANVGADEMARRLDRLQGLLTARAKRPVPIYLTEVGWPMYRGDCEVSEADAGTFTLRLLLESSHRLWLKGVWIYESIDSGTDPANREHRFGLLRRDGSERPAGCMVRELGAVIASRPAQLIRQGSVTAAAYAEAGRTVVFVWDREGQRAKRVRVRSTVGKGGVGVASLPARAVAPCQLPSGEASLVAGRIETRVVLNSAQPAVFMLPDAVSIEGVTIE